MHHHAWIRLDDVSTTNPPFGWSQGTNWRGSPVPKPMRMSQNLEEHVHNFGGWNPSCSITYYIYIYYILYIYIYYIYTYIIYIIYIHILYILLYILNYIYTHCLISLVNLNHHIHTYSNIPNVFQLLCYLYSLAGSIPQMYIIVSDHMNMHPFFFYPSLSLCIHTWKYAYICTARYNLVVYYYSS